MKPDPRTLFPVDRLGAILDLKPIAAGPSGATVHAVTTGRGEFVLRIHGEDRAAWANAVAMQRLAAEHGIAPAVEYVDEVHAATVSPKIGGIPFGAAIARPDVRPAALADLVKRLVVLHALQASGNAELTPPMAHALWQSQANRPGFPSWAVGLGVRLAAACAALARDPRRVLSHGDLHPANILWDGARVWLLDWERAGRAHPYSDLATLTSFLNLPDDAALALVAAQEGAALGPDERPIFLAARERSRLVYGAVFLRLVPDLSIVPPTAREDTWTLAQCYERMRAGTLSPDAAEGQARIGAALLRQVD